MAPKKRIAALLLVGMLLVGGIIFFATKKISPQETINANADEKPVSIPVKTKTAKELASASSEERFPGIVTAESETIIAAATSGTIVSAPMRVGDRVALGSPLATIENPLSSVSTKTGIPSNALRQAEIDASLARKTYKESKRLVEKNSTKENRYDQEIARLKLESAEIALENARDASVVRSTLAGTVIEKFASPGDSISTGAPIVRIASGTKRIARFHVSAETKPLLAIGSFVSVRDGELVSDATVVAIGQVADLETGKFPIEATLAARSTISPNTPVSVSVKTIRPAGSSRVTLPLSAIMTSQEGSFFFIVRDGKAQRISTQSISVSGETATVSAEIGPSDAIVVESRGTLGEGTAVSPDES